MWSESFVQLAGLVDDADWLTRRIANANLWLALWCVQGGRQVQKTTYKRIEARSIQHLRSKHVAECRKAVLILAQMRNERTLVHLLFAARDDDREVSKLSLQSLIEAGEAAHPIIKNAFREDDRCMWRGSLRYLEKQGKQSSDSLWVEIPLSAWGEILEIFGQPMVWVQPGSFLMGSDKNKDSDPCPEELPQHSVILPGYWIGRYPVTVAPWRLFVNESGYKPDEKSLLDPNDHPVSHVNWQDSIVYCKWLAEKTGLPVTLPSKAEWEKPRDTDGQLSAIPMGGYFRQG